MSLTFNEERHEYRWNGNVVPSVTKVIEPAYDFRFVKPEVLEAAAKLGTAVHKTIVLAEAGRLDEARTPDRLLLFLKQWRDFCRECDYKPIDMGQRMFSQRYGVAGTDDTFGILSGGHIVLDIKTGQEYDPHKMQTAGYKELRIENGFTDAVEARRGSLYLDEEGFRLVFHRDLEDRADFLASLRIYNRRLRNGK